MMLVMERLLGRNKLPWPRPSRTPAESADFKNSLINYYDRGVQGSNDVRCMILDQPVHRDWCTASHLWPHATHGEDLDTYFGLNPRNDLNSARNGLLLCDAIEKAFDRFGVCFIYDPNTLPHPELSLFVLDPSLLNKAVDPPRGTPGTQNYYPGHAGVTFADVNYRTLQLPVVNNAPHYPFRRILRLHARGSAQIALEAKWIDQFTHDLLMTYVQGSPDAPEPDNGVLARVIAQIEHGNANPDDV